MNRIMVCHVAALSRQWVIQQSHNHCTHRPCIMIPDEPAVRATGPVPQGRQWLTARFGDPLQLHMCHLESLPGGSCVTIERTLWPWQS